ncbi:hypothetical protein KMW28_26795 [Flammeovirga yaeyamensis]|uniref:Lipoprotein n=1 Tax=Flammeovirga yaeyamensis TaxID=367791 RepID=A0AAX1NEX8_9BACT|nr:hypothetical protein [Flammeovirga yaeyamensis]MBB3701404.1 hypothetical protein [Flammeovirga yaeyamensis]NMF38638.1 hypothetical protein [Flammeovirga yaeyamensis]QWG04508.1 hypothetical protein KMW28_26795 [Flammeovirga yaeyamensis]
MQKLYFLICILLFSSCLNEKTGERNESLLIYSSEGNYLSKSLISQGNEYLIAGVMNEKSSVASINFLDAQTWRNGQAYLASLNDFGETQAIYQDPKSGSIYSSINQSGNDIYVGGTYQNEFLWMKFSKEGNGFTVQQEKLWKNEDFTESIIDLIQKVDDIIVVVGRGRLEDGKEKIYFAGLNTDGEILWEKMNDRSSQYHLPKEIKEYNGKVKVLTWEVRENQTREEVAEYSINPTLGLIESIRYLSTSELHFTDATWLNDGIVGLAKEEEGKDKLYWLTNSQTKEIAFDYEGNELNYLIGKENYFIASSSLENGTEVKYNTITLNSLGDILSQEEFINSVDSRLIGVEYLSGDDQYFMMTSSLLKFKYVLEFRKN